MSQNIASLNFSVDSSQAVTASDNLGKMRDAAQGAGEAHRSLTSRMDGGRATFGNFIQDTGTARLGLDQMNTSIDGLLTRLQDTRLAIGTTVDAFRQFDVARGQVDALARAFGATSIGLESFNRQATQLNMAGPQMVQTFQRITAAIEGQTTAGRQLRTIIQSYGVDLNGMRVDDAGEVLKRFTEASRGYRDTAAGYRNIENVLGSVGFDTMGKVRNPDYMPLDDRETRKKSDDFNRQLAEQARTNSLLRESMGRQQQQEEDLRTRYNTEKFGSTALYRRYIDAPYPGLNMSTAYGQRQALSYMGENPDSEYARSHRNWGRTIGDVFRKGGAMGSVGDWWRTPDALIDSRQEAANMQYRQETDEQGGILSLNFKPMGNLLKNTFMNVFGAYEPPKPITGTLPLNPEEQAQQDMMTAYGVARGGDSRLMQQQAASQRLREYQSGDLAKQLKQMLGDDTGISMMNRLQGRDIGLRQNALTPGYAANESLATQGWIGGMNRSDRFIASDLTAFAQANSIPTDNWAVHNQQISGLLTPGNAYGQMTQSEIAAFRRQQGLQAGNAGQTLVNAATQDMAAQNQQLSVAGQRADVQERLNRELQLEKETEEAMARARTAGPDAVAALQKQIEQVRSLREEYAQTAIIVRSLNEAQQRSFEAQATTMRSGMNAADRSRFDAVLPVMKGFASDPNVTRLLPASTGGDGLDPQVKAAIDRHAADQGVDPRVIYPIAKIERGGGGGTPMKWGAAIPGTDDRAFGTGQLMQRTAEGLGVNRYDFDDNIRGMVMLIKQNLGATGNDPVKAAGRYFAGPNTQNWGPKTQSYMANYSQMLSGEVTPEMLQGLLNNPELPAYQRQNVEAALRQAEAGRVAANRQAQAGTNLTLERDEAGRRVTRARGGEYAGAIARAGVPDRYNSLNPEDDAQRAVKVAESGFATQRENAADNETRSIETKQRLIDATIKSREAFLAETAAIEAENKALAMGLSGTEKQASERRTLTAGLQTQTGAIGDQISRLRDATADSQKMAAAWDQGTAAGERMQRVLSIDNFDRYLEALQKTGKGGEEMARYLEDARKKVSQLRDETERSASSEDLSRWKQKKAGMNDENEMLQAEIKVGAFGSSRAIAEARAGVTADQQVRRSGNLIDRQEIYDATLKNEDLKQKYQDIMQVRQGFLQMGQAASTAFEDAVIGGKNLGTVLGGLTQTLERMALRTLVERPMEKAVGKLSDFVLGASMFGAANGAVFAGGRVVPMAAGGIIDRPTMIPLATGSALTGEGGSPEAVMPLKRLPNGNLGVQSSGGNGGGVVVNAPITINSSGGGGGQLDPRTIAALQKQIEQSIQMGVRATMAQERRNGGDLYQ